MILSLKITCLNHDINGGICFFDLKTFNYYTETFSFLFLMVCFFLLSHLDERKIKVIYFTANQFPLLRAYATGNNGDFPNECRWS